MKVSIKILTTTLLFCLLGLSAKAFVILQDNFNYPAGLLSNAVWVAGAGSTLPITGVDVSGTNAITLGYNGNVSSQPRAYFTNGLANSAITNAIWIGGKTNQVNAGTNAYYFSSNAPVAAIYYSFTMTAAGSALAGTYFSFLSDTNFDYCARLYCTNGPGNYGYQIGIQNGGTYLTNSMNGSPIILNPTVLNPNQTYQIVVRYILNNGLATIWVNPTVETVPVFTNGAGGNATIGYSQTCTASSSPPTIGGGLPGTSICGIGFRSYSAFVGDITIGNLVVGTQFADVVPSSAGSNPAYVASQPQNYPSGFVGANATFTCVMGGDPAQYEQWYFDTNTVLSDQSGIGAIIGSSSNVLTLTNLTLLQAGTYDCVVSNAAGTNASRYANLAVYTQPVFPTITNQPVATTNTQGDSATFSVGVLAVPPAAYQWCFVSNSFVPPRTNALAGANISGTNTAMLVLAQVSTNQAGYYCCIITNIVGVTNSAAVPLVVNAVPSTTIASLYTMVNPSFIPTNPVGLFTISGIVTTFTNMTSSGNTEFCMQDNTAGIWVYWQSAPAYTNLPPAGTKVTVTGPLTNFDGLFEIQPVFGDKQEGVVTNALNQPLPAPIPLPTDPNIINNTALMFSMLGTYMVASNVTLSPSPTFIANVNEPISENASNVYSTAPLFGDVVFTNEIGETGDLFVNAYSTIPRTAQPSGPVTIYGNLGYFLAGGTVSPAGFEFVPSTINEIITYTKQTNYLSNLTRVGDMPTNEFPQSVLRPGETLATSLTISDPANGIVTLTPVTAGLPAGASWSNVGAPGLTATATFTFTPTANDAGTNYFIQVGVSSSSGSVFTNTFTVYVPTPAEQQVYISEIFANPALTAAYRSYNPLQRQAGDAGVEVNIAVDDSYVEIANQSKNTVNVIGWSLGDAYTIRDTMGEGSAQGMIQSSNSYVVYGGPATSDPSLPSIMGGLTGYIEPVGVSQSLSLSAGGGIVTLYNGYTNLIDRVVYPASATNSSLSRFPTINSGFAQQAFVSTNWVTPGSQYDGSTFASPAKIPVAVTNLSITELGRTNVVIKFNATTPQACTIWNSSSVFGPFNVYYGYGPLTYPAVNAFTNPASGSVQYYYMTTQ